MKVNRDSTVVHSNLKTSTQHRLSRDQIFAHLIVPARENFWSHPSWVVNPGDLNAMEHK